jgi:hypothetical protein
MLVDMKGAMLKYINCNVLVDEIIAPMLLYSKELADEIDKIENFEYASAEDVLNTYIQRGFPLALPEDSIQLVKFRGCFTGAEDARIWNNVCASVDPNAMAYTIDMNNYVPIVNNPFIISQNKDAMAAAAKLMPAMAKTRVRDGPIKKRLRRKLKERVVDASIEESSSETSD